MSKEGSYNDLTITSKLSLHQFTRKFLEQAERSPPYDLHNAQVNKG